MIVTRYWRTADGHARAEVATWQRDDGPRGRMLVLDPAWDVRGGVEAKPYVLVSVNGGAADMTDMYVATAGPESALWDYYRLPLVDGAVIIDGADYEALVAAEPAAAAAALKALQPVADPVDMAARATGIAKLAEAAGLSPDELAALGLGGQ